MRKTWKRALSYVLSAALLVTAGGFASLQGSKAAEDEERNVFFTATINSFGSIWGWTTTPEATSSDPWRVEVDHFGEYTLKATATDDASADSGAFVVNTDYTDKEWMGNTALVTKTVKIAGKEYEWKTDAYWDDPSYRMSLWNEWGDEKANPLGQDLIINAGDEVEFTFEFVEKLTPDFTASLNSFGAIWGWTTTPASPDAWSVKVEAGGEYTVKGVATDDASADSGAFVVNTNLHHMPSGFTLAGKSLKIGGKEYEWKAEPYLDGGILRLSMWNEWGDEKANPLGQDLIINAGEEVEATFTVTVKDNGGTTPADTTVVNGPAKGKTFTAGGVKYKVTKAATITTVSKKKTAGQVTAVGLAKKNATSVNVKNSVSKSGASYKVTALKNGAFQKAKKLKKATLGTNIKSISKSAFNGDAKLTSVTAKGVTKIGASAFKGCKKLNKLTLKKKISVSKGAFKGCKKKIKVTGGSKTVNKANVKKLKKSGYKKFK